MSAPSVGSPFREGPPAPEDPLVPLLVVEGGAPDPVALATWHLALTASTAVEVPHDLFGLWLYPVSGGAVLLGPDALAQDGVVVPLPDPYLLQDQLFQLEEVLRRAKYAAVIAVPVRQGPRDVGVMLLGSFTRGAFGPPQALALRRLGGGLTSTLASLGEVMAAVAPHATLEPAMSLEALPTHLARAAAEAMNGPDLVRRVSGVLYALLPHDRLEILATGPADLAFVALSGNAQRRRWSASGRARDPFAEILSRFGSSPTLLVDDLTELETEGAWMVGSGSHATQPARAVLGARLEVGGRRIGYLLLASVAENAYRPEDEDTIAVVASLVATRVSELRLAAEVEGLRVQGAAVEAPTLPLVRAGDALANTAHLGEGLARFSDALRELLPHERIAVHLRWGEDEVIEVDPLAPRPFADIPPAPVAHFHGAQVLLGDLEWLVRSVDEAEEIVVPLRVAGRTVGTLGVHGKNFDATRDATDTAIRFANVLAPHLELLRRGASSLAPRPGSAVGR